MFVLSWDNIKLIFFFLSVLMEFITYTESDFSTNCGTMIVVDTLILMWPVSLLLYYVIIINILLN